MYRCAQHTRNSKANTEVLYSGSLPITYSCAVTADSRKTRDTVTCVLQSQTLMQQIHFALSLKQAAKAMKCWLRPMRQCDYLAGTHRSGLFKWLLCEVGSQFTQGRQTRQRNDKQLGLNKAFRYKSTAATGYLSPLLRPPLPLVCLLPWRHLTYFHPSWLTGVRHSKRPVCKIQGL